jgi:hypothetical protein
MNCLTEDQIAELALGLSNSDAQLTAHVETCDACRSKLAEVRRLINQLEAMHTTTDQMHAASRERLLAKLANVGAPEGRRTAASWLAQQLNRLTIRQRLAAGGIGLTTAIGLILLLIVWGTADRLSAMERMVKQLQQVTSFSFELEEISDRVTGDDNRRIKRNDTNFWRAPASFRGSTKMVKIPLPADPTGANVELRVDVEEIYTPGQRGILIDHVGKKFFRTPEMQPDGFPDYSPVNWVQRMSQGNFVVTGDLGTKQLNGRTAHGYMVSLGNPKADSGQNSVNLWLDPETDLPVEFQYEESFDDEAGYSAEVWTNVMRVFNCRWNVALDDSLFEPIEPAGYDNTTWPTEQDNAVEKIVQALRLYAKLSGGHYPQVTQFDGAAIHDEMLKMAAAVAPTQTEAEREQTLQEIEQATAGLGWLTRILKNVHHTGYYGTDVGPADSEKVLLWWPLDINDDYRVIYGDLRSEPLPLDAWAKLVPADVSESHMPVEYTKPNGDR